MDAEPKHKERPILFSVPMVRAILDDRKTQTRRVAKLNASGRVQLPRACQNWHVHDAAAILACPYGQHGDHLWVRETFRVHQGMPVYSADMPDDRIRSAFHWKPSIFMLRHASRITLEIVRVRLERLQDISEEDARAEGIDDGWLVREKFPTAQVAYQYLWDSINAKKYPWSANPWVWVIEFRRI